MRALSESQVDLIDAVVAEVATGAITASLLEKDEHLTDALRALFALQLDGLRLVFCGGTSLSKGHGLIERMSEDADLKVVLDTARAWTTAGKRNALGRLRDTVAVTLTQLGFEANGKTVSLNNNHYIRSQWLYERRYATPAGLRPNLQIELTARAPQLPTDTCELDALTNRLARRKGASFSVPTVCIAETQAEKVLSFLRRFAQHRAGAMGQAWDDALVRHIYDVHCIHRHCNTCSAQAATIFGALLQGDVREFGRRHVAFAQNPAAILVGALLACEHDAQTHREYQDRLLPLVYGTHKPDFATAFADFKAVAERILSPIPVPGDVAATALTT